MKVLIVMCVLAFCIGTAFGVSCYAGVGTSMMLMDCGTSSNKCIKTVTGDIVAKQCYSQFQSSMYPGFTLSDGCQSISVGGISAEICVCNGDECNGSMKANASTMLAIFVSAIAGYLLM